MSTQQVCEVDVIAGLTFIDDEGGRQVPISITWTYRAADPYAVQMGFPACGVAWLLGRDLLIAGIEKAAGRGAVHVMTISVQDQDLTVIALACCRPDQRSLVFATTDLIEFLARTNDLVPIGGESALAQNELRSALISWSADAGEGGR